MSWASLSLPASGAGRPPGVSPAAPGEASPGSQDAGASVRTDSGTARHGASHTAATQHCYKLYQPDSGFPESSTSRQVTFTISKHAKHTRSSPSPLSSSKPKCFQHQQTQGTCTQAWWVSPPGGGRRCWQGLNRDTAVIAWPARVLPGQGRPADRHPLEMKGAQPREGQRGQQATRHTQGKRGCEGQHISSGAPGSWQSSQQGCQRKLRLFGEGERARPEGRVRCRDALAGG